jgi:geranylgeranyl pyrophosphate synthase
MSEQATPDTGVETLLARAREQVDARLEDCASRLAGEVPAPLGQAVAYALRSSGKRVRPALVLGAYQAAGGANPAIGGVAAAVEVVHTYSLVHDDLPCMDDDDQRRGRPTTHVAFDVPTATRAGWLLVPVAIELLAEAAEALGRDAESLGRMAGILLEAGGIAGMVGGQWLDLEAEGQTLDLEPLMAVHRGKTGALIEACCLLGGMAAGARPDILGALSGYGREIGLAFQIADDVLDATGTTAQLGKTAGRDAALAKSTYVSLLGIEGARLEARRHAGRAVEYLRQVPVHGETLTGLAGYIITRSS